MRQAPITHRQSVRIVRTGLLTSYAARTGHEAIPKGRAGDTRLIAPTLGRKLSERNADAGSRSVSVMQKRGDIENALLDVDGSCRDMNFEGPTWDGVTDLVRSLERLFEERAAYDGDGEALDEPHWQRFAEAARASGNARLICNGGTEFLSHLQAFVFREEDGSPFVELTFFPRDIRPTQDLGGDFAAWANKLTSTLRARRCYCRYEDAGWRFGDTSSSDVFWVSD